MCGRGTRFARLERCKLLHTSLHRFTTHITIYSTRTIHSPEKRTRGAAFWDVLMLCGRPLQNRSQRNAGEEDVPCSAYIFDFHYTLTTRICIWQRESFLFHFRFVISFCLFFTTKPFLGTSASELFVFAFCSHRDYLLPLHVACSSKYSLSFSPTRALHSTHAHTKGLSLLRVCRFLLKKNLKPTLTYRSKTQHQKRHWRT